MRALTLGLVLGIALVPRPSFAQDCTPTPAMSSGTHFEPITTESSELGSDLEVHGRILAAGDCRPVSGARVAHWQAGNDGQYLDRLRAYSLSDDDGSYRFTTEWPAAYVPHIHFMVEVDGYEPLTTQWVGSDPVDSISFDIVLQPAR